MTSGRVMIVLGLAIIVGLILCVPGVVYAKNDIVVSVCDPRHPGTEVYEGSTVNTAVTVPPVSYGENRELGTLRVSGRKGIDQALHVGDRIMLCFAFGHSIHEDSGCAELSKICQLACRSGRSEQSIIRCFR